MPREKEEVVSSKRFWLTCVVVWVVYQILSYLIHGMWLQGDYAATADLWRPMEEMESKRWIMFVTSAVFSVIFSYIFVKGREGKGWMEGVRFGALIGLFVSLPMAYDTYTVMPIPYDLALKWFLSGMVASIVLGVVAALVYKPEGTAPGMS